MISVRNDKKSREEYIMSSTFRNFIISFILAAIIFGVVAVFAVGIIDKYVLNPELEKDGDNSMQSPPTLPSTQTQGNQLSSGNGKTFGVLFMLNDYRPDIYSDYTVPADTFAVPRRKNAENFVYMLFSKEKNEVVVTSLDTGTLVNVDGVDMTLSLAYNYKGAAYVTQKVSNLIGLGIDYYIDFGVTSLVETVNYLGGFEYELSTDISYVNSYEGINVSLSKGKQKLDGEKVMALLRYDSYKSRTGKLNMAGDFLLNAVYSFTGNYLNKVRFNSIINYVSSKCDTNINADQFEENIDILFKMTGMNISYINYPGSVEGDVFVPDKDAGRENFNSYR